MAATVKVFGVRATVDGWEWSSDFPALTELLQTMMDPLGPLGSDPNPDETAARYVVEELGGEVLSFDAVAFDPDAIY